MTRLSILAAAMLALAVSVTNAADRYWVYFGTYTRGESEGVYVSKFDTTTGEVSQPELAGEAVNPSFVALHPSGRFLYSVGEIADFEGKKAGGVTAFSVNADTGKLTKLNAESSGGAGPCHVVCDGRNVLVANYGGGSVAVLPVRKDGGLRPHSAFVQHTGSSILPRQKGPHAHSINLDPAERRAIVADLGLDKVLVYVYDAKKGTLAANEPAFLKTTAGGGPRHFAFHPNSRFAYTNLEITREVVALRYDDETGEFTKVGQHSTLPKGAKPEGSTAEVRVHPGGRFVYVSNRGHDSIAAFRVNERTGDLTPIGHTPTGGRTPRNFELSPDGRWAFAANQNSSNVVLFRINEETGLLESTGTEIEVPNPVCVRFLAADE